MIRFVLDVQQRHLQARTGHFDIHKSDQLSAVVNAKLTVRSFFVTRRKSGIENQKIARKEIELINPFSQTDSDEHILSTTTSWRGLFTTITYNLFG